MLNTRNDDRSPLIPVYFTPVCARCSWQLQLTDVALGLGFKAGDMRSLSRSSGMGTGRVKCFGDWDTRVG